MSGELSIKPLGEARDLISDVRQWQNETGIHNLYWWLDRFEFSLEDQIKIIVFLHTGILEGGYYQVMVQHMLYQFENNYTRMIYGILDTWTEAWMAAIEAGINYSGYRQDLYAICQIYQ